MMPKFGHRVRPAAQAFTYYIHLIEIDFQTKFCMFMYKKQNYN